MTERRLVLNIARCANCGQTMESRQRHDFRWCKCGKLAVDGGLAYVRRCYDGPYEELSEYEDAEGNRYLTDGIGETEVLP